ncbi:ARF1 [Symbiodinium pilosum]|uniref:ARF1 protein n=1 Tax=Symbiodinium pilosum TaxID=2952 RepID=A0A812VXL9_SYMPI|nr:ARF1 [Symbiodinium pilosum]
MRRLQKFIEVSRRPRSQDAERRRWPRRRLDADSAGTEPTSPRKARLCRWQPKIATMFSELAGPTQSAHVRCLRGESSMAGRVHGSSVAIFVVGGITLPEIRAAHEATAAIPGLQAYIGGSCLLTPTSLLEACEAF